MCQPQLSDLVEAIDLILIPANPRSSQFPVPKSFRTLNDILNQDSEKCLLGQWITIKPCQCQPLISAAIASVVYDDQAVLVLLKLFRYPDLVELALGKTEIESQALVEGILTQILIHGQVNVPDQPDRVDEICELCETALPYATLGDLLYSEILLKEVGNWQGVSPSIWNRRVKALFGTQDLSALAKIGESDLELAYANWKTQMQSTDHHDAMISIHIAASLCRLGNDQNLFATASSPTQDREPIDLPPILFKWILRARELFVLPKGPKIIKVTFIRTVKAVVDALSDRSPFLLEMAIMAREILRVVDVQSLNEWDQESATAVQKLTEKLLEPGIPPALMANAFCVLLMGNTPRKCRVPTRFIILFQPVVSALLLQSSHFSPNEIKSPWEFITTLVELLPIASEESVSRELVSQCLQDVLTAIFGMCRPAKLEVKNRLGIAWASLLLSALEKRMSKATDDQGFLADVFCDVVRDLGLPRWWTINLSKSEKPRNCARMRCCPHLAEFSRQQLCKGLSRIFIELSSRDAATASCSDVVKLQAQAQSQMDMATSESTWSVCQFDQVPAHLEALQKGEEKCNELTRVLKSTEIDFAELEQTHQIVKANYSCARERQAYLLQRSQDLSTALQDLHLERGQLHEQLSTTLTAMESEREDSARQMEQIAWDAQNEVQDYELANRGAELLRQEEAEVERSVKEDLQTQIQWLREQHDIKDKEFKDAHDKEIKVMQDQFAGQRTAMDEKLHAYLDLLDANKAKCAQHDDKIAELELQIERITGDKQQLSEENRTLVQQNSNVIKDNETLSGKVEEFEELSEALNMRNGQLTCSEEKWKAEAARLAEEVNELKEVEKQMLEVLQRVR